jgi:hypothetical protein
MHPFSDTNAVDVCLRESEGMLSRDFDAVAPKIISRIWGLMSKFLILDRFLKTLGWADDYPGSPVLRNVPSPGYLGTASKVSVFFSIKFSLIVFV